MTFGRVAVLARWLGPWGKAGRVPGGISTRDLVLPGAAGLGESGRPMRVRFFLPRRRAAGAYLVVPGLHFDGPDDARLDRFARVLASAGFVVAAPFLEDHLALFAHPRVAADCARAFDALLAQPETPPDSRPGIFSISFGSLPALLLAADAERAARIGALVLFGGYGDFRATCRAALVGKDSISRPVIFLNVAEAIPGAPADVGPLQAAWLRFARETWGKEEMKDPLRRVPIAGAISETLAPEERALFLEGCLRSDAGDARVEAALAAGEARFANRDARGHLDRLVCEVHLVHGAGDEVVPVSEVEAIAARLPAHTRITRCITGFYGHTASGEPEHRRSLRREFGALLGLLTTLANAGAIKK